MTLTKVSNSMVSGAPISVLDYGAVPGGNATTNTSAIAAAIVAGAASNTTIYFPAGVYAVNAFIPLFDNTHLFANGDATIYWTISNAGSGYFAILGTAGGAAAVDNVSVEGLKFETTMPGWGALGFAGLSTDHSVSNLKVSSNECVGCSLLRVNSGAQVAIVNNNYIHSPISVSDYVRAIQIGGGATAVAYDISVVNNRILGSYIHGIEITDGTISDQADPTIPKNLNRVVVSGNIVSADYADIATTAGGIFFIQGAEISVVGNVIENYGDVGIDFEACTNAVASSNIVRNCNKNFATYGNSINIRIQGNLSYLSAALGAHYANQNSVSAPTAVDIRNTDIVFDGNSFWTDKSTLTGEEKIDVGTAGRFVFINNKCFNTWIYAAYPVLLDITVENNQLYADYFSAAGGNPLIYVAQCKIAGDVTTTPFRCSIQNNQIETTNNSVALSYPILYIVSTYGVEYISTSNYYVIIKDNTVFDRTATPTSIGIQNPVGDTGGAGYALYASVTGNRIWSDIVYTEASARAQYVNISDNNALSGLPLNQTRSSSGVLIVWADSDLDTTSGVIFCSLANGQYTGQQKKISMSADGGAATVIIATHRAGINQNAVFSAVGQYCILQWNVNAWDTIVATCAGI